MAMGSHDHPFFESRERRSRSCADILVVASSKYLLALADQNSAAGIFPGLMTVPLHPGDPLPPETGRGASLAVLEVDPADSRSMDRLIKFRQDYQGVPVVAAIHDASLALVRGLVREGVADVVALPFSAEDLLETALNAMASLRAAKSVQQKLAPMIAVVRSIGGCGATSIATHLAAEMARAREDGGDVAIVDLDLQFGSVADFLGAQGKGSVADLLDAGSRLDEEMVRSIALRSEAGVSVFAAPDTIMPLESIDTDRLLSVLETLRRSYSCVVLDLPANWTNWTLSAVMAADVVLMVVELSVSSLRQARRRLDLFHSVGIPEEHVRIVVNRVERRLFRTIGLDDVARTLHHPVLASIALEEPLVSSAQDQGQLVTALQRKSRFGSDVANIARQLAQTLEGAEQ